MDEGERERGVYLYKIMVQLTTKTHFIAPLSDQIK